MPDKRTSLVVKRKKRNEFGVGTQRAPPLAAFGKRETSKRGEGPCQLPSWQTAPANKCKCVYLFEVFVCIKACYPASSCYATAVPAALQDRETLVSCRDHWGSGHRKIKGWSRRKKWLYLRPFKLDGQPWAVINSMKHMNNNCGFFFLTQPCLSKNIPQAALKTQHT